LGPFTWPDPAAYRRKLGFAAQPHPISLGLEGMSDPKILGLAIQPDSKALSNGQARPVITFLLKISKNNAS